jgi:phosphoglycerate dehydrogenase-like enzyme
MLRIGYPAILAVDLLNDFPSEVELVPLPDDLDHEVKIDVWLPDPYIGKSIKIWPYLRGVRLVLSLMVGTEWLPPLVGPHVTICNARGAHSIPTAEWTVASILAMLKYFPFYQDVQRNGQWKRRFEATNHYTNLTGNQHFIYPPVLLEELTGKTVLMVGHGSIGQQIEKMLEPFHVKMLRVARSARTEPLVHAVSDLDDLLPQAEIVILILPLTAESHQLIGARQLALMNQGTLLVNAARGGVIDTNALIEALQAGKIRAALDVTDPEPLPDGHPLWSCPNLLLTPHVAGSSPQFSPRAMQTAAAELRRYMSGEPLQNVVQAAL